jgi:hypothetical protein
MLAEHQADRGGDVEVHDVRAPRHHRANGVP